MQYDKIRCPNGTYGPNDGQKDIAGCLPCTAGKHCETEGLQAITGECAAGFYCKDTSIFPFPSIDNIYSKFGECPRGHYCPKAVTTPTPCPVGKFSNALMAIDATTCISCTAGFYCASTGLSAPTAPCEPGFYCPTGSTSAVPSATPCPVANFCPQGSATPTECPIGYYNDNPKQGKCNACPKGYYCYQGIRKTCPKGYICP